jgi:Major Facilitator Superfamily
MFGTIASGGQVLGPVVGGVLVGYLSWRWIFFVNVPIGIVLLGALVKFVPESPRTARTRTDLRGLVLMGLFILAANFGITSIGNRNTTVYDPVFLGPEAVALVYRPCGNGPLKSAAPSRSPSTRRDPRYARSCTSTDPGRTGRAVAAMHRTPRLMDFRERIIRRHDLAHDHVLHLAPSRRPAAPWHSAWPDAEVTTGAREGSRAAPPPARWTIWTQDP